MSTADGPTPEDDLLGSLLAGDGPGAGDAGAVDPHAGHAHAQRPTADVSVRPAIPEDARPIALVQERAWRASLADLLPAQALAVVDAETFAAGWHAAITDPPGPDHRVLTACAGPEVVGFVAFAPAPREPGPHDPSSASPADAETGGRGAEIVALEVDPGHVREGHGSRLLAACVDTVREAGGTVLETWARDGDEARTRFLSSAGFAPAGLRRTLDVPGARGALVEIAWRAGLE